MRYYFIIDRIRDLHIQEGKDKYEAVEKFNDTHKSRCDYCFEAVPCVHPRKFLAPALPEWMDPNITVGSQICLRCGTTPKEDVIDTSTVEDYFRHDKKNIY